MLVEIFRPKHMFRVGREMFDKLYTHRALLQEYVRRELFDMYAGQILGGLWVFIHPIFLMMVYVFVFTFVFNARIGGTYELPGDYISYIMSGLISWLAIQTAMSKACSSLTASPNLIKQVIFPIEVLTGKAIFSTFLPLFVMVAIVILYTLFTRGYIPLTVVLLPVLFFFQLLWSLGIGLILASMNVFVRDVREFVQLFSTIGIFLLPAIYLPSMVPSIFRPILYLNPFSYLVWSYQDALYYGRFEHPWAWVVTFFLGVALYLTGARMFTGLKPYFADAI